MCVCEEVKHTDRAVHWHCQRHPAASILPATLPSTSHQHSRGPGRCALSQEFFSSTPCLFSSWPCLYNRGVCAFKNKSRWCFPQLQPLQTSSLCRNLLPLPFAESPKASGTPICILKGVQLHGILRVTSPTKTTSDKTSTFVVYSNQLKDPYACSNT